MTPGSGTRSTQSTRDTAWIPEEIDLVEARRTRITEAQAANPHIDQHTSTELLAILDRQLAELREMGS